MPEDRDEKDASPSQGVSRRGFLTTLGTGAVAAAAAATAVGTAAAAPAVLAEAAHMVSVTLTINGRRQRLMVEPRWSLLFVIRDQLGLTGTKVCCERGECGSCTVLIDGAEITTLEGLMKGEELGPVQQAFAEEDAFQCAYCTPGHIVAVEGLLRANPNPTLDEIRHGVSGNLCRCGSYPLIFKAAQRAAELRKQRTT